MTLLYLYKSRDQFLCYMTSSMRLSIKGEGSGNQCETHCRQLVLLTRIGDLTLIFLTFRGGGVKFHDFG